jgi:hypothetical protein
MSTWEERMSERARARADAVAPPGQRSDQRAIPTYLNAELPAGDADLHPRYWCSWCGLADPPQSDHVMEPRPPCPRCGSEWQWFGRIADRDGTATDAPLTESGCPTCYEWRRFPGGQKHFGWVWWKLCDWECPHAHHRGEVWYG